MPSIQPIVGNLTLTTADTEYYIEVPAGTKRLCFQARQSADVRYAFEEGKVAGSTAPYCTLKAGNSWESSGDSKPIVDSGPNAKVYFASSVAGTIVEIECWS